MNLKPLWVFMALFFVSASACLFWVLHSNTGETPDPVAYNDIVSTIGEQWPSLDAQALPGSQYGLDYTVLDLNGNVLAQTRPGLDSNISSAIKQRDVILDIRANGEIEGSIIFENSASRELQSQRKTLLMTGIAILLLPLIFCAGLALYLRRKLLRPFRRLDAFARHIAAGNLDVPLEMDKQNLFGPFTESFDLMRSELLRAKENEYRANQSKKELVASLSHDIKTPVASIQAITELMLVQEQNHSTRKNVETIHAKTKQIAQLVDNLFHASLEELEKLKVTPTEESSSIVAGLIRTADYGKRAAVPDAPPCILCLDRLRLMQVFDNIFSNSYKYAGTDLRVEFFMQGDFLNASVTDSGPGVPEESLRLLCNKFYRGKNAKGKNGSGLGLYLSRYLMEQMGGSLSCENRTENGIVCGFCVTVGIPLAGREPRKIRP